MAHDTIPAPSAERIREARRQVDEAMNGDINDRERLVQTIAQLRAEAHWLHTLQHPEA